jgi:hypothetical protein
MVSLQNKILLFFMIIGLPLLGQSFTYSYIDPCTRATKFINADMSAPVVIAYYGQVKTFTYAQLNDGTFDAWINNIYTQYKTTSPCQGVVTTTTTTTSTNTVSNLIGNVTSLVSLDFSSVTGGVSGGVGTNIGGTTSSGTGSVKTDKKDGNNNSNNSTSNNNSGSTSNEGGNQTGENGGNPPENQGGSNGSGGGTVGGNSSSSNSSNSSSGSGSGSGSGASNDQPKTETITDEAKVATIEPFKNLEGGYVAFEGKLMSGHVLAATRPDLKKLIADGPRNPNISFGPTFPATAMTGDTFIRVDTIPNRAFKFNGSKWIEINRDLSDSYLTNNEYIQHLIDKLDTGEYDPELLTQPEQDAIAEYLKLLTKSS